MALKLKSWFSQTSKFCRESFRLSGLSSMKFPQESMNRLHPILSSSDLSLIGATCTISTNKPRQSSTSKSLVQSNQRSLPTRSRSLLFMKNKKLKSEKLTAAKKSEKFPAMMSKQFPAMTRKQFQTIKRGFQFLPIEVVHRFLTSWNREDSPKKSLKISQLTMIGRNNCGLKSIRRKNCGRILVNRHFKTYLRKKTSITR